MPHFARMLPVVTSRVRAAHDAALGCGSGSAAGAGLAIGHEHLPGQAAAGTHHRHSSCHDASAAAGSECAHGSDAYGSSTSGRGHLSASVSQGNMAGTHASSGGCTSVGWQQQHRHHHLQRGSSSGGSTTAAVNANANGPFSSLSPGGGIASSAATNAAGHGSLASRDDERLGSYVLTLMASELTLRGEVPAVVDAFISMGLALPPHASWFTSRSLLTKLARRYLGDAGSQRAAAALWAVPLQPATATQHHHSPGWSGAAAAASSSAASGASAPSGAMSSEDQLHHQHGAHAAHSAAAVTSKHHLHQHHSSHRSHHQGHHHHHKHHHQRKHSNLQHYNSSSELTSEHTGQGQHQSMRSHSSSGMRRAGSASSSSSSASASASASSASSGSASSSDDEADGDGHSPVGRQEGCSCSSCNGNADGAGHPDESADSADDGSSNNSSDLNLEASPAVLARQRVLCALLELAMGVETPSIRSAIQHSQQHQSGAGAASVGLGAGLPGIAQSSSIGGGKPLGPAGLGPQQQQAPQANVDQIALELLLSFLRCGAWRLASSTFLDELIFFMQASSIPVAISSATSVAHALAAGVGTGAAAGAAASGAAAVSSSSAPMQTVSASIAATHRAWLQSLLVALYMPSSSAAGNGASCWELTGGLGCQPPLPLQQRSMQQSRQLRGSIDGDDGFEDTAAAAAGLLAGAAFLGRPAEQPQQPHGMTGIRGSRRGSFFDVQAASTSSVAPSHGYSASAPNAQQQQSHPLLHRPTDSRPAMLLRSLSVDAADHTINTAADSLVQLRTSQPVLHLRQALVSAVALALMRRVRLTSVRMQDAVGSEQELPSVLMSASGSVAAGGGASSSAAAGAEGAVVGGAGKGSKPEADGLPPRPPSSSASAASSMMPGSGLSADEAAALPSSAAAAALAGGANGAVPALPYGYQGPGTSSRSHDKHRGQLPSAARLLQERMAAAAAAAASLEGQPADASASTTWQRVGVCALGDQGPNVALPPARPSSSPTDGLVLNGGGTNLQTPTAASSSLPLSSSPPSPSTAETVGRASPLDHVLVGSGSSTGDGSGSGAGTRVAIAGTAGRGGAVMAIASGSDTEGSGGSANELSGSGNASDADNASGSGSGSGGVSGSGGIRNFGPASDVRSAASTAGVRTAGSVPGAGTSSSSLPSTPIRPRYARSASYGADSPVSSTSQQHQQYSYPGYNSGYGGATTTSTAGGTAVPLHPSRSRPPSVLSTRPVPGSVSPRPMDAEDSMQRVRAAMQLGQGSSGGGGGRKAGAGAAGSTGGGGRGTSGSGNSDPEVYGSHLALPRIGSTGHLLAVEASPRFSCVADLLMQQPSDGANNGANVTRRSSSQPSAGTGDATAAAASKSSMMMPSAASDSRDRHRPHPRVHHNSIGSMHHIIHSSQHPNGVVSQPTSPTATSSTTKNGASTAAATGVAAPAATTFCNSSSAAGSSASVKGRPPQHERRMSSADSAGATRTDKHQHHQQQHRSRSLAHPSSRNSEHSTGAGSARRASPWRPGTDAVFTVAQRFTTTYVVPAVDAGAAASSNANVPVKAQTGTATLPAVLLSSSPSPRSRSASAAPAATDSTAYQAPLMSSHGGSGAELQLGTLRDLLSFVVQIVKEYNGDSYGPPNVVPDQLQRQQQPVQHMSAASSFISTTKSPIATAADAADRDAAKFDAVSGQLLKTLQQPLAVVSSAIRPVAVSVSISSDPTALTHSRPTSPSQAAVTAAPPGPSVVTAGPADGQQHLQPQQQQPGLAIRPPQAPRRRQNGNVNEDHNLGLDMDRAPSSRSRSPVQTNRSTGSGGAGTATGTGTATGAATGSSGHTASSSASGSGVHSVPSVKRSTGTCSGSSSPVITPRAIRAQAPTASTSSSSSVASTPMALRSPAAVPVGPGVAAAGVVSAVTSPGLGGIALLGTSSTSGISIGIRSPRGSAFRPPVSSPRHFSLVSGRPVSAMGGMTLSPAPVHSAAVGASPSTSAAAGATVPSALAARPPQAPPTSASSSMSLSLSVVSGGAMMGKISTRSSGTGGGDSGGSSVDTYRVSGSTDRNGDADADDGGNNSSRTSRVSDVYGHDNINANNISSNNVGGDANNANNDDDDDDVLNRSTEEEIRTASAIKLALEADAARSILHGESDDGSDTIAPQKLTFSPPHKPQQQHVLQQHRSLSHLTVDIPSHHQQHQQAVSAIGGAGISTLPHSTFSHSNNASFKAPHPRQAIFSQAGLNARSAAQQNSANSVVVGALAAEASGHSGGSESEGTVVTVESGHTAATSTTASTMLSTYPSTSTSKPVSSATTGSKAAPAPSPPFAAAADGHETVPNPSSSSSSLSLSTQGSSTTSSSATGSAARTATAVEHSDERPGLHVQIDDDNGTAPAADASTQGMNATAATCGTGSVSLISSSSSSTSSSGSSFLGSLDASAQPQLEQQVQHDHHQHQGSPSKSASLKDGDGGEVSSSNEHESRSTMRRASFALRMPHHPQVTTEGQQAAVDTDAANSAGTNGNTSTGSSSVVIPPQSSPDATTLDGFMSPAAMYAPQQSKLKNAALAGGAAPIGAADGGDVASESASGVFIISPTSVETAENANTNVVGSSAQRGRLGTGFVGIHDSDDQLQLNRGTSVASGPRPSPSFTPYPDDVTASMASHSMLTSVGPTRLVMAVGHALVRLSPSTCGEYDQVLRHAGLLCAADEGVARYLCSRALNSWPRAETEKEKVFLQFLVASLPYWISGQPRPGGSCMGVDAARCGVILPTSKQLFRRVTARVCLCIRARHTAVANEAVMTCLPKPVATSSGRTATSHFGQRLLMEPSALIAVARALEANVGVERPVKRNSGVNGHGALHGALVIGGSKSGRGSSSSIKTSNYTSNNNGPVPPPAGVRRLGIFVRSNGDIEGSAAGVQSGGPTTRAAGAGGRGGDRATSPVATPTSVFRRAMMLSSRSSSSPDDGAAESVPAAATAPRSTADASLAAGLQPAPAAIPPTEHQYSDSDPTGISIASFAGGNGTAPSDLHSPEHQQQQQPQAPTSSSTTAVQLSMTGVARSRTRAMSRGRSSTNRSFGRLSRHDSEGSLDSLDSRGSEESWASGCSSDSAGSGVTAASGSTMASSVTGHHSASSGAASGLTDGVGHGANTTTTSTGVRSGPSATGGGHGRSASSALPASTSSTSSSKRITEAMARLHASTMSSSATGAGPAVGGAAGSISARAAMTSSGWNVSSSPGTGSSSFAGVNGTGAGNAATSRSMFAGHGHSGSAGSNLSSGSSAGQKAGSSKRSAQHKARRLVLASLALGDSVRRAAGARAREAESTAAVNGAGSGSSRGIQTPSSSASSSSTPAPPGTPLGSFTTSRRGGMAAGLTSTGGTASASTQGGGIAGRAGSVGAVSGYASPSSSPAAAAAAIRAAAAASAAAARFRASAASPTMAGYATQQMYGGGGMSSGNGSGSDSGGGGAGVFGTGSGSGSGTDSDTGAGGAGGIRRGTSTSMNAVASPPRTGPAGLDASSLPASGPASASSPSASSAAPSRAPVYRGPGHWSGTIRYNSAVVLQQLEGAMRDRLNQAQLDVNSPELIASMRAYMDRHRRKRREKARRSRASLLHGIQEDAGANVADNASKAPRVERSPAASSARSGLTHSGQYQGRTYGEVISTKISGVGGDNVNGSGVDRTDGGGQGSGDAPIPAPPDAHYRGGSGDYPMPVASLHNGWATALADGTSTAATVSNAVAGPPTQQQGIAGATVSMFAASPVRPIGDSSSVMHLSSTSASPQQSAAYATDGRSGATIRHALAFSSASPGVDLHTGSFARYSGSSPSYSSSMCAPEGGSSDGTIRPSSAALGLGEHPHACAYGAILQPDGRGTTDADARPVLGSSTSNSYTLFPSSSSTENVNMMLGGHASTNSVTGWASDRSDGSPRGHNAIAVAPGGINTTVGGGFWSPQQQQSPTDAAAARYQAGGADNSVAHRQPQYGRSPMPPSPFRYYGGGGGARAYAGSSFSPSTSPDRSHTRGGDGSRPNAYGRAYGRVTASPALAQALGLTSSLSSTSQHQHATSGGQPGGVSAASFSQQQLQHGIGYGAGSPWQSNAYGYS